MTDTFRKTYKTNIPEPEKSLIELIKDKATELEEIYLKCSKSDYGREISLAKTKLEESVMWAVKGLTK